MTLNVLLATATATAERYRPAIARALQDIGVDASLRPDHAPETVDYVVYTPDSDLVDFAPFKRAKAVLSLWAGVEKIVSNPTLTIPLARMVDDGLREGMVEYVTGHVLRHHLGMDAHIVNPAHRWKKRIPPLARDRHVAILGLGELGAACAQTLVGLNFRVSGWSRRKKSLEGIACHHGPNGLHGALAGADIIVLLLPATPETENTMNTQTLGQLQPGAFVINPGRGTLIDDDALIAALDGGQIAHATLDAFREEPLPPDHPFWLHPKVTITPHVASDTRPDSAARVIAQNIRRGETGEELLHLVDRGAGY